MILIFAAFAFPARADALLPDSGSKCLHIEGKDWCIFFPIKAIGMTKNQEFEFDILMKNLVDTLTKEPKPCEEMPDCAQDWMAMAKFEEEIKTKNNLKDLSSYNLMDASRWVGADGTYSATRYVVDSAVGVALGAAGGFIANSVMKSNQSDAGFRNVRCSVGYTITAGWKDSFVISPR